VDDTNLDSRRVVSFHGVGITLLDFFCHTFFAGFDTINAPPRPILEIDPILVGLAILQGSVAGLLLATVAISISALIHVPTNWLHLFLFFSCAFYIPWRHFGKKNTIRAWKGGCATPNHVKGSSMEKHHISATENASVQSNNPREKTERDLVKAIAIAASNSTDGIIQFIPVGKNQDEMTLKVYLEYLCFFIHMTNRFASESTTYQEADEMFNTIVPAVGLYTLYEIFGKVPNLPTNELAKTIPKIIQAREIEYAQSKEYASKEWQPLTGTSIVEMLGRNISKILDTCNPEVLFQIQLSPRQVMLKANLKELIANYRQAHPVT
jgi:hypothetical protein